MTSTKRILIVEDDPHLARVLTNAFRKRGLAATSVRDAAHALEEARRQTPHYAIVDLCLEGASGMTLIAPLRRINPDLGLLVLTGYASLATAVDAIKLGATNYLAKPAYVEEIAKAIGITAGDAGNESREITATPGTRDLDHLQWQQILGALRAHSGNLTNAAKALGMYRRTLQRKLTAHKAATGRDIATEIREQAPQRRRRALREGAAAPAADK
jgi:two-component system response regulator RegA